MIFWQWTSIKFFFGFHSNDWAKVDNLYDQYIQDLHWNEEFALKKKIFWHGDLAIIFCLHIKVIAEWLENVHNRTLFYLSKQSLPTCYNE